MKTLLLVCLLLPTALHAATLRVNNAPDTAPDHTTIQAAINAAADGDTILIEGSPAPYTGFTLLNKRLSLIGPGYGLNANLGTPANKLGAVIFNSPSYIRTSGSPGTANGTLVMGLEFAYDLYIENCSNVTVSRCLFNTSSSGRIQLNGPSNLVSQCFFGGSNQALVFGLNASGARIENCLFPQASLSTSTSGSPAIFYFRNNLFYSLSESSSSTVAADNNIFLSSVSPYPTSTYRNNIFPGTVPSNLNGFGNLGNVSLSTVMPAYQNSVASFDGRYKIGPAVPPPGGTNPAFNAGTDGTHIGPFGGANPYILSGVPPLPTIDELSVPNFAAPGSTMTIRIKVSERP